MSSVFIHNIFIHLYVSCKFFFSMSGCFFIISLKQNSTHYTVVSQLTVCKNQIVYNFIMLFICLCVLYNVLDYWNNQLRSDVLRMSPFNLEAIFLDTILSPCLRLLWLMIFEISRVKIMMYVIYL